jgi:site-specific DNA-methyltransferase (adenine-specific)
MTKIEIFNKDCLEGFKEIPTDSISIICTSPPYNGDIKYHEYKDNLNESDYLVFIDKVLSECSRVLKEDGCLFWNVSARPSNQDLQFDLINLVRKHFRIQNTIHWIKSVYTEDKTYGHVKPINSDKYLNPCHEFIIQAVKSPIDLDKLSVGVPYTDKSNIARWNRQVDLKDRGNTWFMPYETVQKGKIHPASFPLQLPINCIKLYGVGKATSVLDPFLGSGTTALACKQLSIDFIGFEIDSYYIELTQQRLNEQDV